MEQVALNELYSSPEIYQGRDLVTTGRLFSHPSSEFWLMVSVDDIGRNKGIRVNHHELDLLLNENVSPLGGACMYFHPAIVSGTLRYIPGNIPELELTELTKLVVTDGPRTVELI